MTKNPNIDSFISTISPLLSTGQIRNKTQLEKLAAGYGIEKQNDVKEYTELALVQLARKIAEPAMFNSQFSIIKACYENLVKLYHHQVNLSHRTSHSVALQQYSTPMPIAYLAGLYCEPGPDKSLFEPSAGNGMMTIAWPTNQVWVNEVDQVRNANLQSQNYVSVQSFDASQPQKFPLKVFSAVITNPPFGSLDVKITIDGYPISSLEHIMAIYALRAMKDDGRAAIIIGGHTTYDNLGRIQAGKNRLFFNYLYSHFNVDDVINIDGHALYSRMGTAFDTRLILINGRKPVPSGFAPLLSTLPEGANKPIKDFNELFDRVMKRISKSWQVLPAQRAAETCQDCKSSLELEAQALAAELENDGLGAPYYPAADSCVILNTSVPDSMDYETHQAIARIKESVGGSMEEYVIKKLKYKNQGELCAALSAEQVDAVAMAIYNIEVRNQGMIIGDQTGIGKGRIAAGVIRYGVVNGYKPIFLTEKPNLFSDIYRDLSAIGSKDLRPFIINTKGEKTDIKDEEGEVVFEALPPAEHKKVLREIEEGKNPATVLKNYDFIIGTYSQFSSNKIQLKRPFLTAVAKDNVMVMDESHNASGSSQTGDYIQSVLEFTRGVIFLSATFAKRPDNMPVYALKTCMTDANMTQQGLIDAVEKGGVALQEILSSELVYEGQMIRRERPFDGIEVNYITLDQKAPEHQAIADNITSIIRDMITFQDAYITPEVEQRDKIAAAEGKQAEMTKGTKGAGVDNSPYFSRVFNVINQMLFSIKAESVADRAIERLKEGKKPVIAFANTMGSFLEEMGVTENDVIEADFSFVLRKGLDSIMSITEIDVNGARSQGTINLAELSPEAAHKYQDILRRIDQVSTGITISPIDVIKQKIEAAGYSVVEVTGRKYELQLNIFGKEFDAQNVSEKTQSKRQKRIEDKGLQLSDIPDIVKKIMPEHQQLAIIGSHEHAGILADLEKAARAIPKIRETTIADKDRHKDKSYLKQYGDQTRVYFHYFAASTDWWITEWDGQDEMFGYICLNGDWENAELAYISRSELMSIGPEAGHGRIFAGMELDFFWNTEKTLNQVIESEGGEPLSGVTPGSDRKIMGLVLNRKRVPTNDAYRMFNNNEVDCIMINQSGSTGASAQAMPNQKVPAGRVKQRVMIILQAELNINTEVQKRGRINRTGQIMKPIYDYVISAIPAEQRLMMMLQKKLKSLDANTTSNQKQSKAVFDVPDFLNKYGNEIVLNYCIENSDFNKQIGDPLEIDYDAGKVDNPGENPAHKVSGRVAVLSVEDQKQFYDEIMARYNDYVEYLQQTGEYDLEVQTLDLKAKVLDSVVFMVGKFPRSVFGGESILETCEVNNLRKPLKSMEVKAMIDQALEGRSAKEIQQEQVNDCRTSIDTRLRNEIEEIQDHYKKVIEGIPNEKRAQGMSAPELQAYIEARTAEIDEAESAKIDKKKMIYASTKKMITDNMNNFYIGRSVMYPVTLFEAGITDQVEAYFLGFVIDKKSKNPYAPSNIKMRFAVASSIRYVQFSMGPKFQKQILSIRGASGPASAYEDQYLLKNWDDITKKATADRVSRYIVTGNILQAFSDEEYRHGQLVSYTMMDGATQKGILMAEKWQPKTASPMVHVPLTKAYNFVMNQGYRLDVMTTNEIRLEGSEDSIYMYVPASKAKGGSIYLEPSIHELIVNNEFNKVSNLMMAEVPKQNVRQLFDILTYKFGVSILMSRKDFASISETIEKVPEKKIMQMPKAREDDSMKLQLELEAEALSLELELMELAA